MYLIPALVKSHGHGANERFDPGGALVVRCSEPPPNVFIVKDLHFEGKVFLEVFYNHYKERELNTQGLRGIRWTGNERGGNVCAHNLQH